MRGALGEQVLPPRDFGIPRGARVVLTVERQMGVPGVTSLIIAREIPRAATTLGYRTRWEQQMTTASRAAEVDIVVPCVECTALRAHQSKI